MCVCVCFIFIFLWTKKKRFFFCSKECALEQGSLLWVRRKRRTSNGARGPVVGRQKKLSLMRRLCHLEFYIKTIKSATQLPAVLRNKSVRKKIDVSRLSWTSASRHNVLAQGRYTTISQVKNSFFELPHFFLHNIEIFQRHELFN